MDESLLTFLPWIVIFAVFWFIFIRPQRKRQKEREEMLENLKVGNKVITIGGIRGKITKLGEDVLTLQISPELEIEMNRTAIGDLVANAEQKE